MTTSAKKLLVLQVIKGQIEAVRAALLEVGEKAPIPVQKCRIVNKGLPALTRMVVELSRAPELRTVVLAVGPSLPAVDFTQKVRQR